MKQEIVQMFAWEVILASSFVVLCSERTVKIQNIFLNSLARDKTQRKMCLSSFCLDVGSKSNRFVLSKKHNKLHRQTKTMCYKKKWKWKVKQQKKQHLKKNINSSECGERQPITLIL